MFGESVTSRKISGINIVVPEDGRLEDVEVFFRFNGEATEWRVSDFIKDSVFQERTKKIRDNLLIALESSTTYGL